MKKSILACCTIGLILAFGAFAFAGSAPGTGIKQTSHDLSSGGKGMLWDGGTLADPTLDRICIYCHTPHFAIKVPAGNPNGDYLPLWNHEVTVATFQTYTNGISPDDPSHMLNATLGQPGSVSKLCLSCHDGTVAVNSYGYAGFTKPAVAGKSVSGRFLISTDLSNHHPIGFDYNAVAAADDEINPADTPLNGANVYGLTIGDLLWKGNMECSTCHDVHNTKNEGVKFTWVEDTQSALCLTCHKK
ncbi:MAG: cytochrome c3 family protein [Nitrospiraceae bacterium]|nr:cytochrome c3 family protein [Nitrospiraceae bacterium]